MDPGSNYIFSCFQYNIVVLVISFPKWAHLSLNFALVPRYDATKLATTRTFSPICIGKSPKKLSFCFWKMAQNRKNSTPDQFLGPKFGWDLQNMLLHNSIRQIFDFLIFCRDMASFPRKNRRKSQNQLFFAEMRPYLGKKSKIWQMELWRSIFCRSEPNFGSRNWSGAEFEPFFWDKNLVFEGFSYTNWRKCARSGQLCRVISRRPCKIETNESILERK